MAEIIDIKEEKKEKPQKEKPVKEKKKKLFKIEKPKIIKPYVNKQLQNFLDTTELEDFRDKYENKEFIENNVKEVALKVLTIPMKDGAKRPIFYDKLKNNYGINKFLDEKINNNFWLNINNNMLFLANYGLCYMDTVTSFNNPKPIENINQ